MSYRRTLVAIAATFIFTSLVTGGPVMAVSIDDSTFMSQSTVVDSPAITQQPTANIEIKVNDSRNGNTSASAPISIKANSLGLTPGTPPATYDSDNDGSITASELGGAVSAYSGGSLSASELGDVVRAYASS